MSGELFDAAPRDEALAPGAMLLAGFARSAGGALLAAVREVSALAPFRHMQTPSGHRMSVAMTSCGSVGWVTDRRGYRYDACDPGSGRPWPALPGVLLERAAAAAARAGFPGFAPDSCLVNRYEPGARMSLHQDKDERDLAAPIISVSLGLPAVFLLGGMRRADTPRRIRLEHGDVVVLGGPARLRHHGVLPLKDGHHPATGGLRFNLTFRKAR